jgi:hypothetical protein
MEDGMTTTSTLSRPDVAYLSFVADGPKSKGRCFWHVRSTGDDREDEKLARRYALEYLALEEADKGGPGYLQLIVQDMPRKLGPMEISFLYLISQAAWAGANEARRLSAYWDSRGV